MNKLSPAPKGEPTRSCINLGDHKLVLLALPHLNSLEFKAGLGVDLFSDV